MILKLYNEAVMATDEKHDNLKDKLSKALRQKAVLQQKSKLLEEQVEHARARENSSNELVKELLERQRELNIMLNRANIMLNRAQEVNSLLSLEFNDLVRALPAPESEEQGKTVEERVSRIQDLFKKTGRITEEEPALDEPLSKSKVEGTIDAEFEHIEHSERRAYLWQSAPVETPQAVQESEPEQAPEPELVYEQPEIVEETIDPIPEDEPAAAAIYEPEALEEETVQPVLLGQRGYPLEDPEPELDNASAEEADNDHLFPARFRRWMQRISKAS